MLFDRFEESFLLSPGWGDAAETAVGFSIMGYLPRNFLGSEFRRGWPRNTGLRSRWDVAFTVHDLNGFSTGYGGSSSGGRFTAGLVLGDLRIPPWGDHRQAISLAA